MVRVGGARKPANPKRKPTARGWYGINEIRRYQKSTDLLLRKLPFSRVVRDIAKEYGRGEPLRFQAEALLALQTAAEDYLTRLFEDA